MESTGMNLVYISFLFMQLTEPILVSAPPVGVAMYIPTVTPFFLGDVACANCHSSQHNDWAETGHAHAWQTLMESGHPASYCFPCHAVGYEPSPLTGNSGYDEAAIEKFVNVQCENCHGAASDHLANGTPDPTKVDVSFNVQLLVANATMGHHPFMTDWEQSPHNLDVTAHSSASCSGCHEGVAAAYRVCLAMSAISTVVARLPHVRTPVLHRGNRLMRNLPRSAQYR
ncbi:MAG: multiheme c-type cytochrome [Calditrichia bacterium]